MEDELMEPHSGKFREILSFAYEEHSWTLSGSDSFTATGKRLEHSGGVASGEEHAGGKVLHILLGALAGKVPENVRSNELGNLPLQKISGIMCLCESSSCKVLGLHNAISCVWSSSGWILDQCDEPCGILIITCSKTLKYTLKTHILLL